MEFLDLFSYLPLLSFICPGSDCGSNGFFPRGSLPKGFPRENGPSHLPRHFSLARENVACCSCSSSDMSRSGSSSSTSMARYMQLAASSLRLFVFPGITPLGHDPWFKITRLCPDMCLNGGQYPVGVFPGCNPKTFRSSHLPYRETRAQVAFGTPQSLDFPFSCN